MPGFPRAYTTTDKMVGTAKVHVKQVLGFANAGVVTNLTDAILFSQRAVRFALGLTNLEQNELFLKFFGPDAMDGTRHTRDYVARTAPGLVKSVLSKILAGITSEHSVKVADLGTSEGYVSSYEHRAPGAQQGDIHINKRNLDGRNFGLSAITYIHEASHRFAQTHDHGKKGYCDGEGVYKGEGLTAQEACNNADSYAWFVWAVASEEQKAKNAAKGQAAAHAT